MCVARAQRKLLLVWLGGVILLFSYLHLTEMRWDGPGGCLGEGGGLMLALCSPMWQVPPLICRHTVPWGGQHRRGLEGTLNRLLHDLYMNTDSEWLFTLRHSFGLFFSPQFQVQATDLITTARSDTIKAFAKYFVGLVRNQWCEWESSNQKKKGYFVQSRFILKDTWGIFTSKQVHCNANNVGGGRDQHNDWFAS